MACTGARKLVWGLQSCWIVYLTFANCCCIESGFLYRGCCYIVIPYNHLPLEQSHSTSKFYRSEPVCQHSWPRAGTHPDYWAGAWTQAHTSIAGQKWAKYFKVSSQVLSTLFLLAHCLLSTLFCFEGMQSSLSPPCRFLQQQLILY
jgi:hypothetical protein